jgi:hypothetical protein
MKWMLLFLRCPAKKKKLNAKATWSRGSRAFNSEISKLGKEKHMGCELSSTLNNFQDSRSIWIWLLALEQVITKTLLHCAHILWERRLLKVSVPSGYVLDYPLAPL